MLSKYRVCLKAEATVCLGLVLCFFFLLTKQTLLLTRLYGILTKLLFFQPRCFESQTVLSFSLFPPLSLCSPFLLFLGLVVHWPSTHEQLELNLWPWCDLSPLLPNHAQGEGVYFRFSLQWALIICLCLTLLGNKCCVFGVRLQNILFLLFMLSRPCPLCFFYPEGLYHYKLVLEWFNLWCRTMVIP